MQDLDAKLEAALTPHRFRPVKEGGLDSICRKLWKLQTLNLNRAVAIVELDTLPDDPASLLKQIRKEAAWRCGFFPLLYGLGTQLVLVVRGPIPANPGLDRYVDMSDNQWSIIQSTFLVRADGRPVAMMRTRGQWVTGKYQDAIQAALLPAQANSGAAPGVQPPSA